MAYNPNTKIAAAYKHIVKKVLEDSTTILGGDEHQRRHERGPQAALIACYERGDQHQNDGQDQTEIAAQHHGTPHRTSATAQGAHATKCSRSSVSVAQIVRHA